MEQTLGMVKPDGVKRKLVGECIKRFEKLGLQIKKIKEIWLTKEQAEEFRKDIKEKHPTIYNSLIEYMSEGPSIAFILSGENVIEKAREICGVTNPEEAKKGTIRGDFGKGDMKKLYKKGKVVKNIIHTSGNKEEAKKEIELIFEHDAMKQPERETRGGRK